MKDEHPARYVVEALADGSIYEPLMTWLCDRDPGASKPGAATLPALDLQVAVLQNARPRSGRA